MKIEDGNKQRAAENMLSSGMFIKGGSEEEMPICIVRILLYYYTECPRRICQYSVEVTVSITKQKKKKKKFVFVVFPKVTKKGLFQLTVTY
jgi:hypothetical protein